MLNTATQSLHGLPLLSLPLWAPCQRSVSRCREPGADPGASWCGWRHQTGSPGTSTVVCWPPLSRQGSTGTWGKTPEWWVAENLLKMPSGCFNFHCFILLYTKLGWMKFCNICSYRKERQSECNTNIFTNMLSNFRSLQSLTSYTSTSTISQKMTTKMNSYRPTGAWQQLMQI